MFRLVLALCCLAVIKIAAQTPPNAEMIRAKAQETGAALLHGDYDKVIGTTYPRVVELAGGRDKLLEALKSGMDEIKQQGFTFVSSEMSSPTQIVPSGDNIFAIVPELTKLKSPEVTLTQKSYLLGVSSDHGSTWTFIDGSNLSVEVLKMLFSDFPASLKLPPKESPAVERH